MSDLPGLKELERLAGEVEKKRILFELHLACLELRLQMSCLTLRSIKPLIDYGPLKFPLPGFLIVHPEYRGMKFSDIFKGVGKDEQNKNRVGS